MRALERDPQVIPIVLLPNLRELVAVLEIRVVFGAAVAGRQPVDVPADGFGQRAMDDHADVLPGFPASEVELVTRAEGDAAVERAGRILAQVLLLGHLAVAARFLAELRRALGVGRFVELVVELELEVLERVHRGEATGPSSGRELGATRDDAVFNLPTALSGIGRCRGRGCGTGRAGSAASAAGGNRPTGEVFSVQERLPRALSRQERRGRERGRETGDNDETSRCECHETLQTKDVTMLQRPQADVTELHEAVGRVRHLKRDRL